MPILPNARHERFAVERAGGKSADEAYILAGYPKHGGNAHRLSKNDAIVSRIEEIQSLRIKTAGITVDRLLQEYASIATADLGDILEWHESKAVLVRDPDTGEEVTRLVQGVFMKASRELPKSVTAAIAEIAQTKDGLRVKLHSKTAALDSLARIMGQFRDKLDITGTLTLEQLVMQSIREEAEMGGKLIEGAKNADGD